MIRPKAKGQRDHFTQFSVTLHSQNQYGCLGVANVQHVTFK